MRYSLYFVLACSLFASQAQKKRKSKSDFSELNVIEMSDSDSMKAEMTLIEAQKELILENRQKAYELFLVANDLNPNSATINFKIADVLTKLGENEKALQYAQSAIDLDPTNKYYYLITAEIHKALSNFELAASTYETMISKVEDTEGYLFDLAIIYRYTGKYEKALETYDLVEQNLGIEEVVFREKEQIYKQTKNFERLTEDWEKLINAYPDNLDFQVEYIELMLALSKSEKAQLAIEKLSISEKGRVRAELLKSRIALMEGNVEEAVAIADSPIKSPYLELDDKLLLVNNILSAVKEQTLFDRVADLCLSLVDQYPEEYVANAYAGDVMFRLEKEQEARGFYLKAVDLDPNRFEVWQNILNIDGSMNDTEGMITHAERALEYFPNQALLYYFAGTGYLIDKNFRRSAQVLEQGKKYALDPSLLTIIYGQLGDAYNSLKDYDQSYAAYENALQQDSDNDHVLNNYSYFLSLRGKNLDKALQMSSRLVELHPNNPTYLDTHGWVLYKLGNYTEAELILEKAVDLDEDGTVIEHYGDVLYKLGRVDEAIAQWKRASSHGGASKDIEKKIAEGKLYE